MTIEEKGDEKVGERERERAPERVIESRARSLLYRPPYAYPLPPFALPTPSFLFLAAGSVSLARTQRTIASIPSPSALLAPRESFIFFAGQPSNPLGFDFRSTSSRKLGERDQQANEKRNDNNILLVVVGEVEGDSFED